MEHDPQGRPRGLFVGLATLDIIQRVPHVPVADEKVTASRTDIAAGGPALNAAVVFSALGGRSSLVTRLGEGALSSFIRDDVASRGVEIIDLADPSFEPAISTITVDDSTGQRQVVSTDARGAGEPATSASDVRQRIVRHLECVAPVDIVHCDGHHPDLTLTAAEWGASHGVPCVVDAGRWKTVMARLVPLATDVLCSAAFAVPDDHERRERLDLMSWILSQGPELAAVTHGPDPIEWTTRTSRGMVAAEQIRAIDTLGAGDFFHGAYSFARVMRDHEGHTLRTVDCLRFASHVAALKCISPGTRAWLADVGETTLVEFLRNGEA